jgi:hypothetical protein
MTCEPELSPVRGGGEIGDFDSFDRLYPHCHLLTGSLGDAFSSRDIGVLRRRMRGLLGALPLKGAYVTGLVRTADRTELQCRFSESDDAQMAGAWLKARKDPLPGYASHLLFVVDDSLRDELRRYGRSPRSSP